MSPATSILGHPIDIRVGQPHLNELPAAMNAVFEGYELMHVRLDTADTYPQPDYSSVRLSYGELVRFEGADNELHLVIPIGLWINLYSTPVEFEGRKYWTTVQAGVEHVKICRPHLYHEVPKRVDWQTHLFLRQRRIER